MRWWKATLSGVVGMGGCLASLPTPSPADPARELAEPVLVSEENAYNPIPSPDGKWIGAVRTGRRDLFKEGGTGGMGRSNLRSKILLFDRAGQQTLKDPLPDAFLSGWTPQSDRLVCYRDGHRFFLSPNGTQSDKHWIPIDDGTERAVFLPGANKLIWSQKRGDWLELRSRNGLIGKVKSSEFDAVLAPSPNGRYIAIGPGSGVWLNGYEGELQVFDRFTKTCANLSPGTIHPDADWKWCEASWGPWFRDSSRLAFFSKGRLIISTPDGKQRVQITSPGRDAALPTPSPDGKRIAFVNMDGPPSENHPGNKSYSSSRLWVVAVGANQRPSPVTQEAPATTNGLRWLSNEELVFDRIGSEYFLNNARIWRVSVPASP